MSKTASGLKQADPKGIKTAMLTLELRKAVADLADHKTYTHRWRSPKVRSFESPIQGIGLIAAEDIKKGEAVMHIGGVSVHISEIDKFRAVLGHAGTQVDDEFFLVPTARKEMDEMGAPNHSCTPNLGIRSATVYVAMRDIKKGEELTLDYAMMESHFKSFECNCSSDNCRGTVTQDDWQRQDLQKKYKGYFSPYLERRMRANEVPISARHDLPETLPY